jgi:hypothetical protein
MGFIFLPIIGRYTYISDVFTVLGSNMESNDNKIIFRLGTGTALSVAAGLSFYLLCMAISLVGPSGSRVEHADQNKETFLALLLITLVLAAASTYSGLGRYRINGRSRPWFSIGLCVLCLFMLVVLLFNGFAI